MVLCDQSKAAGALSAIKSAPPDALMGMKQVFLADEHPGKVALIVGAYRDDSGQPWRVPAVQEAECIHFEDTSHFKHEYVPISGWPRFTSAAQRLVLGSESPAIKEKRVTSCQALSGTGARHLGGLLLSRFLPESKPVVYIPSPTWHLHFSCFEHVGFSVQYYPYYDQDTNSLDFMRMIDFLQHLPTGSIILLQVCGHNPTGIESSEEQWRDIINVVQRKKLFPFLDCAYQGFASGSLDQDNLPVRLFAESGVEMLVAQSFSKTMGLYGQRVGCLHYLAAAGPEAPSIVERVASQLAVLTRCEVSTPPAYGAKVAAIVLNDARLYALWEENLVTMSDRIKAMRWRLREALEQKGTPGTWHHLTDQIGMFAFTGLNARQCFYLRDHFHIYLPPTGRMSVSDVNTGNVDYIAAAIDKAVRLPELTS